ncbi:MAG TPA: diacylglycerol kinase family protein [Gaiellaceae bacterium]|jgi:diacylglycerol kinase family enzyme|nr:diacylglycerol kinase family protein [Gaiellaceae bacterium]
MPRIALIVNPLATAVDEQRLGMVQATVGRSADVETYRTRARGHATELAREVAGTVDAVFVFSGDGGFNEVVNGLGTNAPPVACIPGGGTSVFPRALGIPRDPVRAAEQLADAFLRQHVRRISVGRVNGRRFLFNGGIGLDAELVRRIEAHRSRAGRPGDAAFVATLLKLIAEHRGRFDPVLEIDGVGRAAFVFVANAHPYTYLGALPVRLAPDARLELGLDLIAPARVRPRTIPRLLQYVLTGRGRPASVLAVHDADRLHARSDEPLPLQVDGEDIGDVTEAVFEAERNVLTVVVPSKS